MTCASPFPAPAATLVLLEDDDGDAKGVTRALDRAGIDVPVIRFTDGQSALDYLTRRNAEAPIARLVALVDVHLPRMSGHEFVAALRADPNLRRAAVFMMTTTRSPDDIAAAYDNNVAGYVVKDTNGAAFTDLVEMLHRFWSLVELPVLRPRKTDDATALR